MSIDQERYLPEMVRHVLYEVDEFRKDIERWQKLDKSDALWNSALEVALLHFRVLREFFLECPKNEGRDVCASYYVSDWENKTKDARAKYSVLEKCFINRVHRRLAHLTTERVSDKDTTWKRGEMLEATESLICSFKDSLAPPKSEWFAELKCRRIKQIVGDVSPGTESRTTYSFQFD